MHKLAPNSLYRLRNLATTGPRFYQISVYMRRLETLGLVVTTGRAIPAEDSVEYEITPAGHQELIERYGASWSEPAGDEG
ncbi:hypothetical protein [Methylobacterium sp. E-066]|uniref:hypothetical protein n=1 Tax=Methylobacterium sp. E-066 TaxID=2836584 RepID=UPI001FBB5965|nr:hypothetical protein [Methylobacterium sp. E-066]MCJ2139578.1 hypothetical protein [Methylobacterium sp. E-066]